MKTILILFVFLCVLCGQSFAADKPNILLILADDLGYGDLRCYKAFAEATLQMHK